MRYKETPTYYSFKSMKNRCTYDYCNGYARYGGRGIKVCERWLDEKSGFKNFVKDMGERPCGMELGRKDNDGDYTPDNCEWITPSQNSRNKSTTRWINYLGNKICSMEAAERMGVKYITLHSFLRRNPDFEGDISEIKFRRFERKLDEAKVREIRKSNLPQRKLAVLFNVSRRLIVKVQRRTAWGHVA